MKGEELDGEEIATTGPAPSYKPQEDSLIK